MDFRTLFFQEPNDVQFEVLFEKLMDSDEEVEHRKYEMSKMQ